MNNELKSIKPFLTFADNAEEAVSFYVSIFPNSRIDSILNMVKMNV